MTAEMAGQEIVTPEVELPVEQTQPQAEVTPESEAPDAKPKEGNAFQKRIDQLTWQKHDTERRLNAEIMARQQIEAKARELEAAQQELYRRATTPRLDQYGDVDQYQRAVEAHSQQYVEQQRRQVAEAMQNQQQVMAQQHFNQRVNAYVAEGSTKFADFAEVVNDPSLPNLAAVNPAVLEAILEDPAIAYYLGKNKVDAHRVANLPPAKAIMEVGRIAAKLTASPQRSSSAPPPPSQVGGNQRASNAPSDRDSMEDWLAKRNAQVARR